MLIKVFTTVIIQYYSILFFNCRVDVLMCSPMVELNRRLRKKPRLDSKCNCAAGHRTFYVLQFIFVFTIFFIQI